MAQATTHHHLLRRLPLLLLLLLQATTAMESDTGFTVELIHRYSPRSPYHNGNLTESQLRQRLLQESISHARWLESALATTNTTDLHPPVFSKGHMYVVQLSIGTGGGKKSFFLNLDTGSSLTWIQCDPCRPRFTQASPLFEPNKSPTYRRLRHDHHLCTHPYRSDGDGNCFYHVRYVDGTDVLGVLSEDTFTSRSDRLGRAEMERRAVFGCAHSTIVHPNLADEYWDGLLGMGGTAVSIPMQMDVGRFSYCLVRPGSTDAGYLQMGGHTWPMPREQRTVIQTHNEAYYLNLVDITVAGRRLHLQQGAFEPPNRHGGCMIDTGTYYSILIRPVYEVVKDVLVGHFAGLHLLPVHGRSFRLGLDVCYVTPAHPSTVLPEMTLHFQGADYVLTWEKLFDLHYNDNFFCWAMLPRDHLTILGAFQQHDVRWSYEIGIQTLSFAPENCANRASAHP